MTDSVNTPSSTPGSLKVADMIQSGEGQQQAIKRALGIFENRGVGNSYLLTTNAGNLLINAGTLGDAKRGAQLFAQVSDKPIRHIVLTQSHANQFGGLECYKTADNEVIAHKLYPQERQYSIALQEHYQRGSRRIFRRVTGSRDNILPTREVAPDLLIDQFHTFTLGDRVFEIHWVPGGETRSALMVWLPEEHVAVVGNLFGPLFGNHPNLNTLRGDKPRSALEFIESVKTLRELEPELILTGHENIRGRDDIQRKLTRIIDSVQWVHDRTIEGMNAGVSLHQLMATIKTPPELTLTEEYGRVAWNVRAIWHEYTGWFDPTRGTTELYEVPVSSIAPALAELSGGLDPIIAKAVAFVADDKPLQALHLLDLALVIEENNERACNAKKAALELLLQQTGGNNLWERQWIQAELETLNSKIHTRTSIQSSTTRSS